MATDNIRKRVQDVPKPDIDLRTRKESNMGAKTRDPHPGGEIKHSGATQYLRMLLFGLYFMLSCVSINISQYLGSPLYFHHKDWYYAWQAVSKQHFGLLVVTMQQWWSPTLIRVSGDASVQGQLRKTKDGRLETDFPERMVLIANHQLYTDWLYLWWMAYTARMHGHLFIILKESLKYIPILGQGMQFFSFIFLSRKWETDKPRFQHRLRKLKTQHHGPMSGTQDLDPMWLLIFPEGTNMSKGGKESSARWSEKTGIPDLEHVLLPRTTGLQFCLQELKGTVDWVYDCTVAYEGIPRGQYGQDIFTLSSTYFQGRPPKSVNMHWRRFSLSTIPFEDKDAFDLWLRERWIEKNDLMEYYIQHGRFPIGDGEKAGLANGSADGASKGGVYIETDVRPSSPIEFLQIFVPWAAVFLLIHLVRKAWHLVFREIPAVRKV